MAIKYLYKCNPLVAKAAGVSSFDRYTWPDGTFLLWQNDLIAIDRDRFFLDNAEFLADLGAVRMTDPEAAEEQKNPRIRLPEARLPEYRWEPPTMGGADSGEATDEAEDSDSADHQEDSESEAEASGDAGEGGDQ